MEKIFITATGTGIGKTFIATMLCRKYLAEGKKVVALKPIISGYNTNDNNNDTALILQSLGLEITQKNIEKTSPWRFEAPLSPHIASRMEGKEISLDAVVDFCQKHEKLDIDVLIIEGVGGVLVPLNDKYTVRDLMARLNYKNILVSANYLGSISHTLTAFEALQSKNITLYQLMISESGENIMPIEEFSKILANFLPVNLPIVDLSRAL